MDDTSYHGPTTAPARLELPRRRSSWLLPIALMVVIPLIVALVVHFLQH